MILLPLAAALLAQVTPVQPIVKGTGLPLQESEEAAVLARVDALFAGVEAGDAAAVRAQVRPDGGATIVEMGHGVRHLGWDQYLAAIGADGHRRHERFTGTPAVEVDGDIAMVWGEYAATADGAPRMCGVDHLDLVREGDAWKVQNLTRSQRADGCGAR
jgi:hypothetical protein